MSCLKSKVLRASHYSLGTNTGLVLIKILAASWPKFKSASLTDVIAVVDYDVIALYISMIRPRTPF